MRQPIRLGEFLDGPWTDRSAVLADLDGCLISGGTALPGARDLFHICRDRLWIVSNNSTDTSAEMSARLALLDLDIPPNRILLAGEETLRNLAMARPGAGIALYAAPALHALATELGLNTEARHPDIVVLARDTGFDFSDLAQLVGLLHRGVPLVLTNPDHSHPAPDGSPVPETGALLAAVASILPDLKHTCLGKPAPDMIRRALMRAGVLPGAAVFIGDTPETDGTAAAAAGVEFILLHRPGAATVDRSRREAAE